jgi:hypothetical protein
MPHGTAAERADERAREVGTSPAPNLTVVPASSEETPDQPSSENLGESPALAAQTSEPTVELFESKTTRTVRHRQARIRLILQPRGHLRRYVLLDSEKLRVLLGQPYCREIDPLPARQEHFELRTSELWAIGIAKAKADLRELYERIREREAQLDMTQAEPTGLGKNADVLPSPRASRPPALATPGNSVRASAPQGPARGELLNFWHGGEFGFGLDLYDREQRRLIRIEDIDLMRALELSNADIGDVICVVRQNTRKVAIQEQRTGSHGHGKRVVHGTRTVYAITVEIPRERAVADRT